MSKPDTFWVVVRPDGTLSRMHQGGHGRIYDSKAAAQRGLVQALRHDYTGCHIVEYVPKSGPEPEVRCRLCGETTCSCSGYTG